MNVEPTTKELKVSKAKRLYGQQYKYYVPTGVGEEFIHRVANPDTMIDMISAANGIGKTALGVNIFAHLMFPIDSEWFSGGLFNKWPYPKRARIVSDPATIVGTIIPELKAWFPAGRYTTEKKGKNYEYFWETDTGWEFDIMSYDQDPKEFESVTLGLAWLDEPPPESIYKATISRLRRGGKMVITQTPIGSGAIYLYDQIILNKDNEREGRTFLVADVESACMEHGERGFLRHKDIDRMVAQYSEDEKQARIFGKYQHLTGLVYKNFDRNVHVIRPFTINVEDYTVYEALDPHPRMNDAVLWVAVDRNGTKFVIDELWLKPDKTAELAQRIKANADQYRIQKRVIDPSAYIVDQHTGKSLHQRLSFYGINYSEGTKRRTDANRRIGDAFDYQRRGDEIIVTPELYIFDNCQRTIWEIEHWVWDNWTGKTADKKGMKEKPVDKDDHMIECLGRIMIQEPMFVPYIPPYQQQGHGVAEIADEDLDPY